MYKISEKSSLLNHCAIAMYKKNNVTTHQIFDSFSSSEDEFSDIPHSNNEIPHNSNIDNEIPHNNNIDDQALNPSVSNNEIPHNSNIDDEIPQALNPPVSNNEIPHNSNIDEEIPHNSNRDDEIPHNNNIDNEIHQALNLAVYDKISYNNDNYNEIHQALNASKVSHQRQKVRKKRGKREIDETSSEEESENMNAPIWSYNEQQQLNNAPNLNQCIFVPWNQNDINQCVNDPMDIDYGSDATIRICLDFWAKKIGVYEWLQEENPMQCPMPQPMQHAVNQETMDSLNALDKSDKEKISEMYNELTIKDPQFVSMLTPEMHQSLQSFSVANVPKLQNNNQKWSNIVNHLMQQEWEVNQCTIKTPDLKKDIEPLVDEDDEWYPAGSEFWMTQYWYLITGQTSKPILTRLIKAFNAGLVAERNNSWCPRNVWHLHCMFKECCAVNTINVIRTQISSVNKNVMTSDTRTWAYDSFAKDLEMYLQIDTQRHALLAPTEEYYKLYKHNPIHLNERKNNIRPRGKVSLSQCRVSHFGFWRSIERVIFVLNKKCLPEDVWDTLLIVPGTFITNAALNEFGLVTDIIAQHWTFQLHKQDSDNSYIEWSTRLLNELNTIQESEDNIDNCHLYPEYELQILPLQWMHDVCTSKVVHKHWQHKDEREIFLNTTRMDNFARNLLIEKHVSDDIEILSLCINNELLFPDPNLECLNIDPPQNTIWYWNLTCINTQLYTTLSVPALNALFKCLKDPYSYIWSGRVDPNTATMAVIPLQMNSDGFEYRRSATSNQAPTSTKENYICPMSHLLSKRMIASFGVCIAHDDNTPFYKMFAKECILMMFKGIQVTIDTHRVLNVFLPIISILNDSAEFKSVAGVIGPNGGRNDYYTVLNRFSNKFDDINIQPERHWRVLLTQQHINYLFNKAPTIFALLTKARVELEASNSRKYQRKNVGYYINKQLTALYSYAGISSSKKPELPFLNALTLSHVEFAHLMFHHILKRVCEGVKDTFWHFSNQQTNFYLEELWHLVTKCIYRPSGSNSSNLRNSSCGTQSSLKCVVIYRSAFELAINTAVLGFANKESSILSRLLTWIGCWFCDTNTTQDIRKLIQKCFILINDIASNKILKEKFVDSPALRNWRNLMSICTYYIDHMQVYFGLMYEGANKTRKGNLHNFVNVSIDKMIQQQVAQRRLVKDVEIRGLKWVSNRGNNLGSGIIKIIKNNTDFSSNIRKLMQYEFAMDEESLVMINDSTYWNKHIWFTKPTEMQKSYWLSYMNVYMSSLNMHSRKYFNKWGLHDMLLNVKIFLNTVLIDCEHGSLDALMAKLIVELSVGTIKLSIVKAVSFFYRSYQDSICRVDDMVWIRCHDGDRVLSINQMLKIDGFDVFMKKHQLQRNNEWTSHWDQIICVFGNLWVNSFNESININLENFTIDTMPALRMQAQIDAFSAEYIVQQLYGQHDHVIPTKHDHNRLRQIHNLWPTPNKCHWPEKQNKEWMETPPHKYQYCGVGWQCFNTHHDTANCIQCNTTNGSISSQCQTEFWPFYKAYSIYQGFIPRLFNCRRINELGY